MYFKAVEPTPQTKVLEGFGDEHITVTNRMLLKDGKPWLGVMGEFHYSRYPADQWEKELQKMKDGGIEVVASYVFWIHHEETKGEFTFSGNRDLRRFISLCNKLGLKFFLRIGPWSHGECRNGGFPDWVCQECRDCLRTLKKPYIDYVRNYIQKLADEIRGLPLLGIQVDNELTNGAEYLEALRQMVLDAGLTAPLLTATAWGNADLPDTLLPMFGGYPEAPWEQNTQPLKNNGSYCFSLQRCDELVGADLLGRTKTQESKYEGLYPHLTCEVGPGNQVTYHRRPYFSALDIESLVVTKIGSGANLLGYYMYHGGMNPVGKTTMQEIRDTGYQNDYPIFSYDFQSPIGDQGQLRESYFRLQRIHSFLHHFGSILAPMDTVLPDLKPASLDDRTILRCALRTDGKGGFLFVNNHMRLTQLPAHPGEQFRFDFRDREISLTLDIPSECCFILPINLTLAGLKFQYITAQPVSMEDSTLVLQQIPNIDPVVVLENGEQIPLQPGMNQIGNTQVKLIAPVCYIPTPLQPLNVVKTERTHSSEMLLDYLHIPDLTTEYTVSWDEKTKWIVIGAQGNVAGFWAGNELISDFYLYGDLWVVNVENLAVKSATIQIQPLQEEDDIYLECPKVTGTHVPSVWGSEAVCLCI